MMVIRRPGTLRYSNMVDDPPPLDYCIPCEWYERSRSQHCFDVPGDCTRFQVLTPLNDISQFTQVFPFPPTTAYRSLWDDCRTVGDVTFAGWSTFEYGGLGHPSLFPGGRFRALAWILDGGDAFWGHPDQFPSQREWGFGEDGLVQTTFPTGAFVASRRACLSIYTFAATRFPLVHFMHPTTSR